MKKRLPGWPLAEKPDGTLTVLRAPKGEPVRLAGRVVRLHHPDHFGFIRTSEEGRADYFFHRDACVDDTWNALADGDRVEFTPELTAKGPRALRVEKVR